MIIFNYTYKKCGKHPKKVRPQLHICGYGVTRHPEKYMLRLWADSVFMSFGNKLINTYFPLPGGGIVRSCCKQHSDSSYNTRTQAYRRFHSYHGLRPIAPVL